METISASSEPRQLRCNFCLDIGGGKKRCKGCRTAVYCNQACQSQHWSSHKEYCNPRHKQLKKVDREIVPFDGALSKSEEEREGWRRRVHAAVLEKYGDVPHCVICGDIESESLKLNRMPTGYILCSDCVRIQSNFESEMEKFHDMTGVDPYAQYTETDKDIMARTMLNISHK